MDQLVKFAHSYNPLPSAGKRLFEATMAKLKIGTVTVEDKSSSESVPFVFGEEPQKSGDLSAKLVILNPWFYVRILFRADLGFAEAFITGEIAVDNLALFLKIMVFNRENLNNLTFATAAVAGFMNYVAHTRLANTISNSPRNITAHYDIGNELFESFLDETMMYSSAVWQSEEDTLYTAQMRKIQMILEKAQIKSSHCVLEIGTGWGTLAIEAVKRYGCEVFSVTLSKEQKQFAEARIAELDREISSKIHILLLDYRKIPEVFNGMKFDRIVSIEMIEAVGHEFLPLYFNVIDKVLHERHGIFVFQCITMPEPRYMEYLRTSDFIQQYIFPGGHCPTVTALVDSIAAGSRNNLIMDHCENIGPHYAKTLRVWKEAFLENFDSKLATFEKYIDDAKTIRFYSEEFKKKWEYYFSYCEAGFATRTLGNVQMVLTRERNLQMLEGLEDIAL